MKVLQAIDGMHPRDGGPPAVAAGSALALQNAGVDVSLLTSLRPEDDQQVRDTWSAMLDCGVDLITCPPTSSMKLRLSREVKSTVSNAVSQADVVHLHGFWSPLLVAVARTARAFGVPYFFSTHGLLSHHAMTSSHLKWAKKQLALHALDFRSLFRDASGMIFGSQTEAAESHIPFSGIKKVFIPNGVDSRVGRKPVSGNLHDALLKVSPEFDSWDRVILFYSRIHPTKGLTNLVQGFNRIADDFPKVGLLIAGLERDPSYRAEVENHVAQCPAPDRITLTTDLVGPESHFVYSLCDIFALPSHAEGFSVALTEALAHSLACLISPACHLPEVAAEGGGVIVASTPEGVEHGLREMLSLNDEGLEEMQINARALFEKQFTWECVAEQLKEAYAAALENHVVA